MFLCGLMANQEVALQCGEAGAAWDTLAAVCAAAGAHTI